MCSAHFDRAAELRVGNEQRLLALVRYFFQYLLQRLGYLALDGAGDGRQRHRRVVELLKVLQLQQLVGLLRRLKVQVEILRLLKLLLIQQLHSCLCVCLFVVAVSG